MRRQWAAHPRLTARTQSNVASVAPPAPRWRGSVPCAATSLRRDPAGSDRPHAPPPSRRPTGLRRGRPPSCPCCPRQRPPLPRRPAAWRHGTCPACSEGAGTRGQSQGTERTRRAAPRGSQWRAGQAALTPTVSAKRRVNSLRANTRARSVVSDCGTATLAPTGGCVVLGDVAEHHLVDPEAQGVLHSIGKAGAGSVGVAAPPYRAIIDGTLTKSTVALASARCASPSRRASSTTLCAGNLRASTRRDRAQC